MILLVYCTVSMWHTVSPVFVDTLVQYFCTCQGSCLCKTNSLSYTNTALLYSLWIVNNGACKIPAWTVNALFHKTPHMLAHRPAVPYPTLPYQQGTSSNTITPHEGKLVATRWIDHARWSSLYSFLGTLIPTSRYQCSQAVTFTFSYQPYCSSVM